MKSLKNESDEPGWRPKKFTKFYEEFVPILGTTKALVLSVLINRHDTSKHYGKLKNGQFFLTNEELMFRSGYSLSTILKSKRELKELHIINSDMVGFPPKEWYTIDFGMLKSLIIPIKSNMNGIPIKSNMNGSKSKTNGTSHYMGKSDNSSIPIKSNRNNINRTKYHYNRTKKEENHNNIPLEGRIIPPMFEEFWNIYPRKVDKGKAKTAWDKLCSKVDPPTWVEIRKAIHYQKLSERWKDPQFIPHPTTWLNNSRWLDDPKEMTGYLKVEHKPPIFDDGRKYIWDSKSGYYKHCRTGAIYIP